MKLPIVLMLTLCCVYGVCTPRASAQSREQRAKGQACKWCKTPIDPTDYVNKPGAPYEMYCNEECIGAVRKEVAVESSSYITPIFIGLVLIGVAVGGVVYLRGLQEGPAGPQASELMRQAAAQGRAPTVTSLGTAHFRCTSCGRNLPSASNCTYCGGEVEPLG